MEQKFINTYCTGAPAYMMAMVPVIIFCLYKLYRAGYFHDFFKR